MSSFKDNFTRNQGDQNLQYDDSAFYFFAFSVLSFVSVITGLFVLRNLFKKDSQIKRVHPKDKSADQKKLNQAVQFKAQKYSLKFYFLILLFLACIYFAYQTSKFTAKTDDLKRFDPYEILEIQRGASQGEIKKAYRKMVLLYHPDKNPSPEAAAKFLLVTKANECLTDETKMKVCEQFGSPDGPGSLQVAIAMPSFFQKKENHVFVLALFSVLFVILVPIVVLIWLNRSQSKNNHGMLVENYMVAFQKMTQNMAASKLIEIIGYCAEFRFPITRQEQEYFTKKTQFLEEYQTSKNTISTKGQKLLILYFEGIEIPKESQKHFAQLMSQTPCILESAVEHCLQLNAMLPKGNPRYLSVQTLLNTIHFQQHFFQGVWSTKYDMDLMQISSVQSDKVSFKKLYQKYRNLKTLQNTPVEQRKYDIQVNLDEAKKQKFIDEVNQEVDSFPNMKMQFDVLLDEQESSGTYRATSQENKTVSLTIEEGQIFNLKVGITRENIPEKEEGMFAICHKYPYVKDMYLHVFVTDKERIFQYQQLTGQARYIEFNEKMALPQGEFSLELHVKPDCYIGMDEVFKFNLKVTPRTEKHQNEDDIHPEDIEKFKEPTFVQKLMGQLQEQEQEEEEDEIPDITKDLGKANTNDDQEEEKEESENEQQKSDDKKKN
ncbi:DnaJ-SEC63-like protein, putative (macronuclear) [Tetrahymena thermophila SB210]|uniref:DnaJ-SEC63-like protein, putative n=1 Tax=Tetrahymena thermophila (strain SB210) TaxID=312017 RepID=I7M062_TETTS|nr:DnaJ-SEC63-like protein, putative [Tetrahymena thermophila SB210]EAR85551.2 DnaJ-SEC63-like protein, putative [Tetrahymena thermophila SB210]|eukprot:XP_001033214.2 DnaJ-SEC63-like protein, putative [Tetrahymena thermophila SB210]